MDELRPYPGLAAWGDRPPRELTNDESLERARAHVAAAEYEDAEISVLGVLHSPDASDEQRAEALRLRAIAVAEQGFLDPAIEYAEEAVDLDPYASGLVPAGYLRTMLVIWRHRLTGEPLSLLGR
jgi:tetratricopeptide (TPR) repeat protein